MKASALARHAVDLITGSIGWMRRNHIVIPPSGQFVKVNLGAGLTVAPGWLNVDGSLNALVATAPRWLHPLAYRLSGARLLSSESFYCGTLRNHSFIHHDLVYGVPFPDQSVDVVYSSHFLEHLDPQSGRRLLQECLRVLKPGGLIRICVPDLEYAWELYKRGEKERMLRAFFFNTGATGFSEHRYAYDFDTLSCLLMEIGFSDVERASFQAGAVPDLEILDNYEEYTLFVEDHRPIGLGA